MFSPSPGVQGSPGSDSFGSEQQFQTQQWDFGVPHKRATVLWVAVGESPPGCPSVAQTGTTGVPLARSQCGLCVPVRDPDVELCASVCGSVGCGENSVGVVEPSGAGAVCVRTCVCKCLRV